MQGDLRSAGLWLLALLFGATLAACHGAGPAPEHPHAPTAADAAPPAPEGGALTPAPVLPIGPVELCRGGRRVSWVDQRGQLWSPVAERDIDSSRTVETGESVLGVFRPDGTFSGSDGTPRALLLPDGRFQRPDGGALPGHIDDSGALHIDDRGLVVTIGADGAVEGHGDGLVVEGLTEGTRRLALFLLFLDIVH